MTHDEAYRIAEAKIEEARRSGANALDLRGTQFSAGRELTKLKELPESIGQLTQLRRLNISDNHLTELPESIGQLTNLQGLGVYRNDLNKLPDSIGRLTQLQGLDLTRNRLTELPDSIGQLTQLRRLVLTSNRLTELPESIGQLTQLQELALTSNHLKELPGSIKQLTQLQHLYLASNHLKVLPESIRQLTQLRELALASNHLKELPESIKQLTQLTGLYLLSNQLKVIPEWIGELTQLEKLDLSSNQLMTLPESIWKLTQLQLLNLSLNQFTELPESIRHLARLVLLNLSQNQFTQLPESIGDLARLLVLNLSQNQLTELPESMSHLARLQRLDLSQNQVKAIPEWIGQLTRLKRLDLFDNQLAELPESVGHLTELAELNLSNNRLVDLPFSIAQLEHLVKLRLYENPINPELAEAYKDGFATVRAYLRARAVEQVILNEAKLILVGEGEVGKSCLLGALRNDDWEEGRPTTHGIEIKSITVTDPESNKEITLNGWDFGGQRVYRPTHQLFFSAPAVYLVVWKPREGPQQGFVKEWIRLIKYREPDAKILVVASHGGPGQRQPDIDRQELLDLFGNDTVMGFFHIDSKPDTDGKRRGIAELRDAIAHIAVSLPEVGRTVPKYWQDVRHHLLQDGSAYMPLERVLALCRDHHMDEAEARLFITISHRLGHIIHYQHDPTLRDIVVVKPDWLATAISLVLDDEVTRSAHGLVSLSRLGQLWDDPTRPDGLRYPAALHHVFLRLMERFDLSYRVAGPPSKSDLDYVSLIAQLVPDNRPDPIPNWPQGATKGDSQQVQICRIVDQKGQSATAEGLFYQLIVRLHRYSLGRINYNESIHWQRGLVLDDDYNGRVLLELTGNDVRITVRAPYPERFLVMLTEEVKYLVESFWEGLRCDVMVPCISPCGKNLPGTGLFEVGKLITFKRQGLTHFPCIVSGCDQLHSIDSLLRNSPAIRPQPVEALLADFKELKRKIDRVSDQLVDLGDKTLARFDQLDDNDRRILSRIDDAYDGLMRAYADEAKDGPRLFSLIPTDRSFLDLRRWTSAKFKLILWCEHSRLPLPMLNGKDSSQGIYELELTREWFKKAAPLLRLFAGTLNLVLPVASAGIRLALDETTYKELEDSISFGKEVIDATLRGSEKIIDETSSSTSTDLEHGEAIRAEGATLRELHALLKPKDPSFGGLVRVMNKRHEFLWVHPQFEKEY